MNVPRRKIFEPQITLLPPAPPATGEPGQPAPSLPVLPKVVVSFSGGVRQAEVYLTALLRDDGLACRSVAFDSNVAPPIPIRWRGDTVSSQARFVPLGPGSLVESIQRDPELRRIYFGRPDATEITADGWLRGRHMAALARPLQNGDGGDVVQADARWCVSFTEVESTILEQLRWMAAGAGDSRVKDWLARAAQRRVEARTATMPGEHWWVHVASTSGGPGTSSWGHVPGLVHFLNRQVGLPNLKVLGVTVGPRALKGLVANEMTQANALIARDILLELRRNGLARTYVRFDRNSRGAGEPVHVREPRAVPGMLLRTDHNRDAFEQRIEHRLANEEWMAHVHAQTGLAVYAMLRSQLVPELLAREPDPVEGQFQREVEGGPLEYTLQTVFLGFDRPAVTRLVARHQAARLAERIAQIAATDDQP